MNWNLKRWLRHEFTGKRALAKVLPSDALQRLTQSIADSEKKHGAELRLAVECGMDLSLLLHGVTPRERSLQVFSNLRVWDTQANNGVLIYLSLADRDVEIVADRGIDQIVGAAEWERICRAMEVEFRQGRFEQGLNQGIAAITGHLERHFPHRADDVNELPDAPVIL
ncbi:MAG TPA: hypothetical protein DCQ83_09450 [Fibrobacteres bacterium]|jgi:uncharacterized membrane protein|nr:hypothetical protein [Fibrobacterota bacterium]